MIKKPSIVKQLKYFSIIGCVTIYYSLGMYSFGFSVGQEESIPSSKILVQDTTNNKIKSFTGYNNNLWMSLNGPYSDDILSTLIPANNYILIGTPHNIVMSSDNGITWSQVYGPSAPVETINRDVNGNILAVIGNGMQYAILSLDSGRTWNPIRFNNDSVLARIFLSENGSLIIQKKNGKMYHTRDY